MAPGEPAETTTLHLDYITLHYITLFVERRITVSVRWVFYKWIVPVRGMLVCSFLGESYESLVGGRRSDGESVIFLSCCLFFLGLQWCSRS